MTKSRIPADRDPDAIATDTPLRYDWQAEGAVEAIQPTIDRLARICDRIAQRRQHPAERDTERKVAS